MSQYDGSSAPFRPDSANRSERGRQTRPHRPAPAGSSTNERRPYGRSATGLLDRETEQSTRQAGRPPGRQGSPARDPRPAARPPVRSVRGRRQRLLRVAPGRPDTRIKIMLAVLLVMLIAATVRLSFIQGWTSDSYAAQAADQRARTVTLVAQRGTISDRNGTALAFTVEGRAIAARPTKFADDAQRQRIIDILVQGLGSAVDAAVLTEQLHSTKSYVYLVRGLMPAQADAVMTAITGVLEPKKFGDPDYRNAVVTERQDIRQYPDGGMAKAVVGDTSSWSGHGSMGVESKFDALLAGQNGSRTVDVYGGGVIPGSARDQVDAINGTDLTLTLDFDLQYSVNQMLQSYVDEVGAKRGMALVEDVKTGEIYSINTYEPGLDPAVAAQRNIAVSSPFEPGSVNKIVTFAAALDAGLITPTSTYSVGGAIQLGGRTIHDAWPHGTIEMTATGILAKSSNVGTLQIAQQLGPDAFSAALARFGIGSKTGIELAGESGGELLDQSQWSATTFANLPIGQGLSMTLVQMASMYQAVGNGGVRLPPTLVLGTTAAGSYTAAPAGAGTIVMTPSTAQTLLGMLRAITQDGDLGHRGTAPGAAITGYQVAGKTGTAQQIDPQCRCYSDSMYNSTFAGLVPADNPRFVIAIMLDAPQGGKKAVPLFHDIAAYAMRAFDVPPSAEPAPVYDLYLNY